ncbi:MAG: mannosyl-glycoprotein endo-beta-N-acetylglucosamidase [Proteobacteria bacterium]|nr:mannosyl-glycoprotein endo-beta-N-acetylglucosamidase [Pseudomonadota bacterium]
MTNTIFNDIGYLGSLRAEAVSAPSKAIEEVASQFEALFIQQMMKSMRDAVPKSDFMHSDHLETYQSMADQQMAVSLSQQGGIGIARMLVEQMQSKGFISSAQNSEVDTPAAQEKQPESFRGVDSIWVNTGGDDA